MPPSQRPFAAVAARSRTPAARARSFIFLGPTGTGQDRLAKTLAEYLFGSKDALISFDMSEFGSQYEVSKLIGSPPGYVGHEEGGQLTKAVRRSPYSVVLFDEIEKAHPDIFNILLQVLDEGRLTDSQGKTVDFRNTVVIMTSNVGAREIAQDASVGFGTTGEGGLTADEIKSRAMGELKRLFRPEFINRVDDIVVFQKLQGESLTRIAELLVADLRERLIANGMNIVLTDEALDKIVREGTDLSNGARPLRRAIQRLIEVRSPRSCWRGSGMPVTRCSAMWRMASSCSAIRRARSRAPCGWRVGCRFWTFRSASRHECSAQDQ